MGVFCPSPIPHHGSPPPLCLSDRRTLFMRSFSLRNGRSASVPHQPPCRDLQKRLRPNESIHPRAPFQSTTKTSQTSSLKKPLPISPLVSMGPRHRASSPCQTPQKEDGPPLPHT